MRLEKKGPGVGQGLRHRGARRPRDPQPGPRDREPLRQGPPRDHAHDRPRPRLRPGRAEPRARAHDRRHPGRLDLLARAPRLLRGRGRARRPAHRLRQADPRRDHRRLASPRATRSPRPPRSSSASSPSSRTSTRSRASARRPEAEAEAPQAHGMENFPIEELELGVRSYNCLKRVGIETIGDLVSKTRERARRDPELRQEVDRGGQRDAPGPRASRSRDE